MAATTTGTTSHAEAEVRARIERLLEHDPSDAEAFLGAQYDLGLAWVHFPEGAGGLGADRELQRLVHEAVVASGVEQPRYGIGYGMAARPSPSAAPTNSGPAGSVPCSPARRSGASCSPSRAPAPTWPAWPPARCATATNGW